ncbi:FG-GAP-like repeat-containing protein [Mesorhizobium sp. M0207]|uniref:FG-GAP-like repeat-containing protein n=1 Tax=Mesorhizobium sp. M0207 TaxID=2956915 RepID=UPI003334B440
MAAFAQEAQGTSSDPGAPANGGLGNGGAAMGSGGSSDQPSAADEPASGSAPATEAPDAAAAVGTADQSTDSEAAPEEPAAAAATATTTTTSGDPEAIGTPKVDLPKSSGNGNLGYAIGIDVSDFHGIEPSIALNYDSSRRTKLGALYQGWLGYAWGLGGFDVIERASPGYGMPAFDGTDIYLLDGQQLVACVAGTVSPSCSTGGTHATENESYRRIALNGTTNEWKVTDRDGTVSTFRSVAAVANLTPTAGTPAYDLAQNYRWLLTSVTDPNGNSVAYSYTCPASPVCYPDTINYNGTVVKFYLETRPDPILMGNGRDISETSQRIKAIGVTVGTALRGAYKLTYDQAPFSNASRLTAVTRYGTDAAIAADGTITGGTAKPLGQMTYQNTDGVYTTVNSALLTDGPLFPSSVGAPNEVGDLDFDGRDEIFGDYPTQGESPTGQRTASRTKYRYKFNSNGALIDIISAGLNAAYDGKYSSQPGRLLAGKSTMDFADTVTTTSDDGHTVTTGTRGAIVLTNSQLALTNANCRPIPIIGPPVTPPPGYEAACDVLSAGPAIVADADADGIDTVNGGGFGTVIGVGDFLGNGHQQPLFAPLLGGNVKKAILSNGTWESVDPSFSPSCSTFGELGTCVLADVNGDGATDIFHYKGSDDSVRLWLSTGVGFKEYTVSSIPGTSAVLRDFDNDGRMDVITIGGTLTARRADTIRVFSLRPSSTAMAPVEFTLPARMNAGVAIGDFNGDGLPDFTDYKDHMFISAPGAGNPNLLRSVVTELGGTVAVEYAPSSTWVNTYLPQVVHAVTKLSVGDGRGQTAVSTYAYAGGKYDPAARKFLGFASIVETKPLANGETAASKIETIYRQDLASYGLPSLTVWKDGAGTVHKQVTETYAVNTAIKPYTVQNTATDTTLTETLHSP